MIRRLVTIDLRSANLETFERYEMTVLALLPKYGGSLEMRMRAIDGSSETHLIAFPDASAHEAYLNDPERQRARPDWVISGATSTVIEVELLRIDGAEI